MHISEGVLSPVVLAGGAALAAAGVAVGLRKLDYERLMTVAILASVFFVGSLIHVPIGVTSVHLLLNGLLGVVLGWAAFPAILAALVLQALLFQYGGLTILGVNTFTMASAAVLAGYACRGIARLCPTPWGFRAAAFCAGALGVALAAVFTACALAFTDEGFVTAAQILLLAHLPVMLAEGFVTMFTIAFIARVRPEMLEMGKFLRVVLLVALLLPSEAFAHRVNIFAFLDNDAVAVECDFGKKSPVRNGRIRVYDNVSGVELLQGTTDARGGYRFPVPDVAGSHGLRIRVDAGEGHQNEWVMDAAEFGEKAVPAVQTVPETSGRATRPVPPDNSPRVRDIVGGIGWLVGLAGIALYVRERRLRRRESARV